MNNNTPSYKGFSFASDEAIVIFTTCLLYDQQVPNNMGIAYDMPI